MNDILKHYSELIWKVRNFTVVQTFVIFTAIGYTVSNPDIDNIFAYGLSGIGVLFTFLIMILQLNYIDDFETHLEKANEENWVHYKAVYDKRNKFKSGLIQYGIYSLIIVGFASIFFII